MPLVSLCSPYQTWRGKDQTAEANVLYPKNGRMHSRRNVTPNNPRSPLQQFARLTLATLSRAYSNLTPAQLETWDAQARHFTLLDFNRQPYHPGPKPYFISVNWYRALTGLPLDPLAPTATGPTTFLSNPALTIVSGATEPSANAGDNNGINENESSESGENISGAGVGGNSVMFASNATIGNSSAAAANDSSPLLIIENHFTLHSANNHGYVVLEATAPLPGNARKPRANDYRLINILSLPHNIQPATPGTLTFTAADDDRRFTYQPGNRLALRATLLTADFVRQSVQTFTIIAT